MYAFIAEDLGIELNAARPPAMGTDARSLGLRICMRINIASGSRSMLTHDIIDIMSGANGCKKR